MRWPIPATMAFAETAEGSERSIAPAVVIVNAMTVPNIIAFM
jgi:hypothetical protein